MVVLAHISDTHLDGLPRAHRRAEAVMAYLRALSRTGGIDAIVHTGDVTDHGLPAEYAEARTLLAGPHPLFHCPGNHDRRAAYREGLLSEAPSPTPINQLAHVTGRNGAEAVIAMCDSSIPDEDSGRLADETLEWLDKSLSSVPADVPALIAFHHPPVVLGIPYIDGIRQFHTEGLADVVRAHANVAAILCGHAHTAASATFAGRPVAVAGGVVSTVLLPYEPGAAQIVDLDAPPIVSFHTIGRSGAGDWTLTTHHRPVPLP